MQSILFDEPNQDILTSPWQWRIVSSLFQPDVAPSDDRTHRQWMPQHQHQNLHHEEILIALQGNGFYGLQNQVYPCQPGSVFLFNLTDFHDNGYSPAATEMTHLWIHLMDGSAYALVQKVSRGTTPQILCRVDFFEESAALRMFLHTWRAMQAPQAAQSKYSRPQLIAELYLVVAEIAERSLMSPSTDDSFSKRVIRRIADHIAANGELNVNIDDLALIAGYSKYHFARLFRKHTGQTVHHFLDGCRLSRTIEMLEQGHRRKEVAAALGFKHESSFSRWHKTRLEAAMGGGRKKATGPRPGNERHPLQGKKR